MRAHESAKRCGQSAASVRVGLALLVMAWAAPGAAQACGAQESQAMSLTQDARVAFQEARYERSRALLQRALELCEQPIIVFNLARVSIETGDLAAARGFYVRYLEMRPDAPDREEVERRIASLEDDVAEHERLELEAREAQARAERARAEADAARARVRDLASEGVDTTGPWVVGVAGLSVLGGGLGFAVAAQVESEVPGSLDHLAASALRERARTYALIANIGFAIGGAAVLAASIWGVVLVVGEGAPDEPSARVQLGLGSLAVDGRF